ncbi:MAG TPA: serine acetyltransferase, partial [Sphingobacteriaceae bacterium]
MDEEFLHHIRNKQLDVESVPPNAQIAEWALQLIHLLFPEHIKNEFLSVADIKNAFYKLEDDLEMILSNTTACQNRDHKQMARNFFRSVPDLYSTLNTDASAALQGDPAAKSEFEIIRTYPGFYAICFYRIAHKLLTLDIPLLPRILTEYAHSRTGIDVHPGAQIGKYFFIDHGTGTVI